MNGMTVAIDSYYAREADRIARGPQLYGGNAQIATLRCFMRYHADARQEVELGGRLRYLTHKQVRMLGLFSRIAVTYEHTTFTAMAREANVAPSTVSRFALKVQAWGEYAIDVKRGKYGGVTVRLRTIGDGLRAYAERAWERIKRAVSRTKSNVASTISMTESGYGLRGNGVPTTYLPMDATLKPGEAYGCRVRGCEQDHPSSLPLSFTAREADARDAEYARFARETIAEIRRLEAGEPDWDVYLDKVRASYGMN